MLSFLSNCATTADQLLNLNWLCRYSYASTLLKLTASPSHTANAPFQKCADPQGLVA